MVEKYEVYEVQVLEVSEENGKWKVRVSPSPLYPDGKGGQLGDRGEINGISIQRVIEEKGDVYLVLADRIKTSHAVLHIDLERRMDIAQQHTAQHILSAAFAKVADVDTVGFRMGERYSTIDLNVPHLTSETLHAALELTNRVIRSCVDVDVLVVSPAEIEDYGLRRKVDSALMRTEKIRLVRVGDFDIQACGGFHVKNTGEIGMVGIIKTEKVKRTLTRVYFLAGVRLERYHRSLQETVERLMHILTCSAGELEERVEALQGDVKNFRTRLNKLADEHARLLAAGGRFKKIHGDISLVVWEGDEYVARFLPKYLKKFVMVVKVDGGFMFASDAVSCRKLCELVKNRYPDSRGGAGETHGRIQCTATIDEFLRIVEEVVVSEGTATQR